MNDYGAWTNADADKLRRVLERVLSESDQQPIAHERIWQIIGETLEAAT